MLIYKRKEMINISNKKVSYLLRIHTTCVISLLLLLTLIMTSCAAQSPELTLKEVDVQIEEQIDVRFGEEGEFFLTVLYYRFYFENTSRKTIGSMEKPIKVSIEYETDLIPNASKQGGGWGYIGAPIIAPNEVGVFEIYYGLGAKDAENITRIQEIRPLPEQEVLDEIESKALDAILVVTENHLDPSEPSGSKGERELMRIDLREYKD